VKDSDQNKDATKVETLNNALNVEIDSGDSEALDLRETGVNTGEFAIDGTDKLLKLTFALDDVAEDNNGLLEFTAENIQDDVLITYSDSLDEDGNDEEFSTEFQLMTIEGIIDLPVSADLDGTIVVTLTDGDLNDDAKTKESYSFTLTGKDAASLKKSGIDLDDLAAIQVSFNDEEADFDDELGYTLVETGVDTGIFNVEIEVLDLAESVGVEDSLDDGDSITFSYFDSMEEPDEQDFDDAELNT
jgi:hypothetical protein